MKPLHVGLLVFCATVAIGIAVIVTHIPASAVPAPVVPQAVVPQAVITPPATTADSPVAQAVPRPRRKRQSNAFLKRTRPVDAHAAQRGITSAPFDFRTGGLGSGGIFSGSDPNNPGIYH